jgi:2-polyprenyl-6-methoxyphenol hydroxylase-like FAD-dependent oxidoreductase
MQADMTKRIVIVGGGTAGWLTAAYLVRTLAPAGWRITLVESAAIGIIGVGEGTFPTIRDTLAAIGIDEREFLRKADGSFKQGVRFAGWAGRPTPGNAGDDYFHPFNLPFGGDDGLLPYWIKADGEARRPAYADAVTAQGHVIRAGRAPKRASDAAFTGPMNYAYHFDAARFADHLREVATANGVERIEATIGEVRQHADGRIAAVVPDDGRDPIEGDFFVDCSGFRALLIGKTLNAPFKSVSDVLFNDRALAIQVPHAHPDDAIRPYTLATAHEAGWTWDIGLGARRGIGYVYSSRHSDDDAAERTLRAYLGDAGKDLTARQLRFHDPRRPPLRRHVPGIPRLGIPAAARERRQPGRRQPGRAAQGRRRHGAAVQPGHRRHLRSRIAHAGGAMIGSEARAKTFNVLLAGGVNLTRDPWNGRNFEYLGEDPLLAGDSGRGASGRPVEHIVSTIKHFALNAQETGRMIMDARIDEAACAKATCSPSRSRSSAAIRAR